MKYFDSILAGLALFFAVPLMSHAGQGQITATNSTVLAATTNLLTSPFYSGNSSDITFQPICTFTNASTNTFVYDGSADSVHWQAGVIRTTVSQTATTTNTVSGSITNIAAGFRYPFWRVWVENPSVYATKTPYVATFTKTGI